MHKKKKESRSINPDDVSNLRPTYRAESTSRLFAFPGAIVTHATVSTRVEHAVHGALVTDRAFRSNVISGGPGISRYLSCRLCTGLNNWIRCFWFDVLMYLLFRKKVRMVTKLCAERAVLKEASSGVFMCSYKLTDIASCTSFFKVNKNVGRTTSHFLNRTDY